MRWPQYQDEITAQVQAQQVVSLVHVEGILQWGAKDIDMSHHQNHLMDLLDYKTKVIFSHFQMYQNVQINF